ncbi:MAG TPA: hypothetical protein VKM72_10160 [Thermoanaerobaculia bacterium]|nr:hypothetical protein [Thermoanaerobaculia bacterium]
MIMPMVLRGVDYLPEEIKNRQLYDFSSFTVASRKFFEQTKFARVIEEIARSIYEKHRLFAQAGADPCADCDSFRLPTEQEIEGWPEDSARNGNSFPLRS